MLIFLSSSESLGRYKACMASSSQQGQRMRTTVVWPGIISYLCQLWACSQQWRWNQETAPSQWSAIPSTRRLGAHTFIVSAPRALVTGNAITTFNPVITNANKNSAIQGAWTKYVENGGMYQGNMSISATM